MRVNEKQNIEDKRKRGKKREEEIERMRENKREVRKTICVKEKMDERMI